MILALLMLLVVVSRIIYPFDTGYIEAFAWVPTGKLLAGANPYAYSMTPPYSMVPYDILYYALLAIGQGIFGLQMWFGRTLSVIACVVCIRAAVRIAKNLTGTGHAAWVTCLVSLALFPVQAWVGLMRSDLLSLAFGLTALSFVFALKDNERISVVGMTAIVMLSAAAVFTKHTTMLPAVMIVLRFLQLNRRRNAAIFAAFFLLISSIVAFVLNYTSEGGYVWQHFIHAGRLPFSWHGWSAAVLPLAATPTFVVFAIASVLYAYTRRKRNEPLSKIRSGKLLVLLYLLLGLITGLISSGRVGANANYFLETSFVLAIVCGLIWNNLLQTGMRKVVAMISLFMVFGGAFQLFRFGRGEYFRWQSRSYYQEVVNTATKYIRPGSACVSVYAELVMPQGCELHFDDYGEYVGGWSPELTRLFEEEVRGGHYALIIWDADNFGEKFPAYRLVPMTQPLPKRFFPVYLYVRKTEP